MMMRVTNVSFARGSAREERTGLLGLATVELNAELVIHRVAVRRTRDGRDALSFPAPSGRKGRRRGAVAHPLGRAAHAEIERQVFAWLRRNGRLAP
jgi:DNA-binding cell septation regulator SpoVG